MRSGVVWCLVAMLAGCGRKNAKPESVPPDAAAVVVTPSESIDAGTGELVLAPPPIAKDFTLVAVPRAERSKVIWLIELGERVWLSGKGLDAYADGDGPLTPGPDLLRGIPYNKDQTLTVIGNWPRLFAMRAQNPVGREGEHDVTLFAFKDGAWTKGVSFERPSSYNTYDGKTSGPPDVFVPWGDGALLADGQTSGWITWNDKKPGTKFYRLAPDGTFAPLALKVEPSFIAMTGASDGKTLSLLGAAGISGKQSSELHLVRGDGDTFTTLTIVKDLKLTNRSTRATIRERGDLTMIPPLANEEAVITKAWGPDTNTIAVVEGGKMRNVVAVKPQPGCSTTDAAIVGTTVYAIRSCSSGSSTLYRTEGDASPEVVRLPSLATKKGGGFIAAEASDKKAISCAPTRLVARGRRDLFVRAICPGDVAGWDEQASSAVFRLGHPQEPVVIP